MLIPKKNRKEVYKYLFKEGVLFAEKDFNLKEHPEIPGVSNLQVIKLMQSFTSKELVTERFAWRHYYWFLTDEGIEFLREYLNLPSEIVPATLKKSTRPLERGGPPQRGDRGDRPPRRFDGPPGGGGGYRESRFGSREGGGGFGRGGGDKEGAPGAYRPQFGDRPGSRGGSGGFGRGAAPPS
ncbi:g6567 [Coccomyxa viridis]|uniref:G6567 protein n=1 Tax=Coccomyxa viridis TaxID=1274662 RepID=A0ABP1FWY0_9CHLO